MEYNPLQNNDLQNVKLVMRRSHRMTHRVRIAYTTTLLGLIATALPWPAAGQTAYSAANGHASIQPWKYGFLSGDFNEAAFGLTFVEPVKLSCLGDDADSACVANQINFSLHVTGAALKGSRDLLSKVDFLPGFDAGGGVAYVMPKEDGGYDLIFLRGTYSQQVRNVARIDLTAGTTTIGEIAQITYAASVGYNHGFSAVSVIGISFETRREIRSPGVQRPMEVCGPGRSAGGFDVLVCADRYAAPLPDLWRAQGRVDLNLALANLGSSPTSVRLGLISAGSVDITEEADSEVNVSLGSALHLPEYPAQPILALVFGIRNVLDENTTVTAGNPFGDQFLARLTFSIPFRVMAGTP